VCGASFVIQARARTRIDQMRPLLGGVIVSSASSVCRRVCARIATTRASQRSARAFAAGRARAGIIPRFRFLRVRPFFPFPLAAGVAP
jgi:hypothetical protein